MASNTPSLATFYNVIMRKRGYGLGPHMLPICRALEDRRIQNLMLIIGPGSGKSTLISIVYPAWRLGINPETTILGVSAGEALVQGFMHGVMEVIEYSQQYRQFFPNTQPDKGAGWSTERGLFVTGHSLGDPDASFWGAGLDSKSLGGKHARELIFDDLHDDANSATSEQCEKVRKRYYNTLMGRADPRGARRVLAGRRWNEEDLYGHFSDSGDWVVLTLPNERETSRHALYIDVRVPIGLECCFTDTLLPEPVQPRNAKYINYRATYGYDPSAQGFYWPEMSDKRKEYFDTKRNFPAVAQAVYQCDPGARKGAVFLKDQFVYFGAPLGLADGIRNPQVAEWLAEKGGMIIQIWDTATGQSTSAAYSVGMTMLLVPSNQWHRGEDPDWFGEPEMHYLVYVLHVHRKKLDFGQLSEAVRHMHRLWRPKVVLVENKSSGISLLQTLRGSSINIKGVKAIEGKIERAIDAVGGASGSAQGWMQQGRCLFPADEKWLGDFEAELIDFTSDSAGKKDQVDAFVHGVNFAIQQGGKGIALPSDDAREEIPVQKNETIAAQVLAGFGVLFEQVVDPFADRCGGQNPCFYWKIQSPNARGSWCRYHARVVSALDSCDHRRDLADVDHEEATYG